VRLYNYFRSSAAYRVRIALNLKGIAYDNTFVHLTRNGGEQFAPEYKTLNPQGLVPALDDDGEIITQSLAMLEYLDEKYPNVPLLPISVPTPQGYAARARVRALALAVCCDIHPLNNLRVLKAITKDLGADDAQKSAWIAKWISSGFAALETQLARSPHTGAYCHGDSPTIADCCLVPQVFSARRFNVDLSEYPTITRIDAQCNTVPAFIAAQPKNQPDFEA
jgi:maleylacetoacetate isomerase